MSDAASASPDPVSMHPARGSTDVLIVGGGPAGLAAGWRLATEGHRVAVVERRAFPRNKTCGDALTPRAVHAFAGLGFDVFALPFTHRVDHVRIVHGQRSTTRRWPTHQTFGRHGAVVRRSQLDDALMEHTIATGARVITGHEAIEPIVERGFVRGAVVRDPDGHRRPMQAKYVVVADGANSRFGRALGTERVRSWPYATAIRSYWESPLHDTSALEFTLAPPDRDGNPVTGFGWVFPLGDGTVSIGIGVSSTSRDFRSINTSHMLHNFAESVADRWSIDPSKPLEAATSGRVPIGSSIGPTSGPTYLVIGDAAGVANPVTGAGIEYAVESGIMAGRVLASAISENDATALQRYPKLLADSYGAYYKVGRLVDRFAGRPRAMSALSTCLSGPGVFADSLIRIAANEMRPQMSGPAEFGYRVARTISRFAPDA